MILEELEHLLIEQGFQKVPSNLPEFTFFFRRESTYVNVLHVIDYRAEIYLTEEGCAHVRGKIAEFFGGKGIMDTHILSLLICADPEKARKLCVQDAFCWLIDPEENRLYIYENQIPDFYGMKKNLEDFLFEVALHRAEPEASAQQIKPYGSGNREQSDFRAGWRKSCVNMILVAVNVILFLICTFTGEMIYNVGTFSVEQLIGDGEWYRMVTSMFLHADISHIVSNMLLLYYIGNIVERQIGHLPYLVLYFLSGLTGNVFSAGYELLSGEFVSTLGASGAVFGVEGALLMLALVHKGRITDMTTGRIAFAITFSLYCGFTSSYVNNAAHIGGVLAGFLAAGLLWLLPEGRKERGRGLL